MHIGASALNWIASFLTGRTHSVRVGTKGSKLYNILFGVPQGSILCPLLFILYTSNITDTASHGILIHLYAVDTQLYVKLSTRDIENTKTKLANCFSEIQSWCSSMWLKLNATPAKPNSYGSQEGPRMTMILLCKLTRTAASNHQTWCEILEFFSTTHCQ